jgi:membrane associated rhomboid family serine protease
VLIPIRDHNPRERFPVVTVSLIVLNALVFFFQRTLAAGQEELLVKVAGAIPYEISHWRDIVPRNLFPLPGSIWTSMFLHGGWMHLIGNMWFLWLFGDNVEESLGRARYLIFYFAAGTIAALAQCFSMPMSMAPMIGASGAIAGVLGGYVMLYPRARVVTFVAIPLLWNFIDIPAWIFLGIWFLSQFLISAGSGVAWMAHVGGFLAGVGLIRLLSGPRKRTPVEAEYLPPGRWR